MYACFTLFHSSINKILTLIHDSYLRPIELNEVARRAADVNIEENIAYSPLQSRGGLPSPPIIINPQAEEVEPQESLYDIIPGENQPSVVDIKPPEVSYEIMSPIELHDSDKVPETTYEAI